MKVCLILNVIDPKIDGVIIMGDRGTDTANFWNSYANPLTRVCCVASPPPCALVDLPSVIKVIAGDLLNSFPEDPELMSEDVRNRVQNKESVPVATSRINMVDLPLEDCVCGTIDIEKALSEGVEVFEPGFLAMANRGILYVDEVNLLEDHLVDVLLESAASG